jgi:TonB-linked SusC/RagA family outer membrane protein
MTYKPFKNFTLSTYNVLSIWNRNTSNGLDYGRNILWPVYNDDGSLFMAGSQDYGHPLLILRDVSNKTTGRDFVTSLGADWELIPGLTLHSQVDYQYKTSVQDVYRASTTSVDASFNDGTGGIAQINLPVYQNLLSETYLTYNKQFNKNHALTVMAGHSYNFEENRPLATTARGFINDVLGNQNMDAGDPEMRQIYNNGYYKTKLLSFYGRINYSLMDKYLFTATMRADGSSKFGINSHWGYFPSGAVSWKMHNEEWLKDVNWLDELKLRASFGISGNQGINAYQTLDRYGNEKFWSNGKWNTAVGPGLEVGRTGADNRYMMWGGQENPNLKWESTDQWNVGADAAFFGRRLRLTADFYYKHTYDLLRERFVPITSAYDKQWVNDGEVLNRGFEISVDGDIISTKDWTFSAGLMYSMNRNEVTSLGDAISSGLTTDFLTGMKYEVTNAPIQMFAQNVNLLAIGQPMYVFYGYRVDGIIQEGEDPGFIDPDGVLDRPGEFKYVDLNGDYMIDDKDRQLIGDPNPDFIASLNLSARWRNLDMSVFFYSMVGHDVLYHGYTNDPRVKTNRWTMDNPTDDFPRLNATRATKLSDYFIQDGSFLRIQNVNIGYNIDLPNSFLKGIRIYANIDNLYTFTKFDGYDPEVGTDGVYWGGFPKFRKYSLGVDFTF